MNLIFYCVLLGSLAVIDSKVHGNLADNLLQYLKLTFGNDDYNKNTYPKNVHSNSESSRVQESNQDYDEVKQKEKNEKWAKKHNFYIEPKETMFASRHYRADDVVDQVIPILEPQPESLKKNPNKYFHIDPVLNSLRRHRNNIQGSKINSFGNFRRKEVATDTSKSGSSSLEMKHFKDEFLEKWQHKKFEAMNSTPTGGDSVNMVAARPWGVPCGDPNQHDMPWGSCMLAVECDAEFRIYRGDFFCGRTQFVCCSLLINTYDTNQAFDVSFTDKSLSTDSAELNALAKDSKEKKRKREKAKRKRKHDREKRKKRMKKHIKKIISEIRKLVNRQFKNGTKQRKKRTKQLKKFIKHLKKEYKKNRNAVKDLHELDLIRIDKGLMQRLKQIKQMNTEFVKNETFRQIVLTGTMTMNGARMLMEAYPDLETYFAERSAMGEGFPGGGRRAMGPRHTKTGGELEYDLEYGYLYY